MSLWDSSQKILRMLKFVQELNNFQYLILSGIAFKKCVYLNFVIVHAYP